MVLTMVDRSVPPPPHLGGVSNIGNNKGLALALWGERSTGNPAAELSLKVTSIHQPITEPWMAAPQVISAIGVEIRLYYSS